jgi:hypothetical protein
MGQALATEVALHDGRADRTPLDVGGRGGEGSLGVMQHERNLCCLMRCRKANMSHPTKNWGFWQNDKHNGK